MADGTTSQGNSRGQNATVLVVVSGSVKMGEDKETPARAFNETFVLIPNPASRGPKARTRGTKEWLIQSQNFRFVV